MEQSVSSIPENAEDYHSKDGLLYCGRCHTPKEAIFANGIVLMGKNKHPVECACQKAEREQQESIIRQQKHIDHVRRLKADGFSDPAMLDWTFENALMEQEVPVHMTNFARILNDLNSSFSGRNEVVDKLCRYPLLIIDDFGMERSTEYALEQIYNIVDNRYRSRKPLIVTTNLILDEIRHPQDTAHARIYDRLLEMCVPISCIGMSFRKETAQEKLERLKFLIG